MNGTTIMVIGLFIAIFLLVMLAAYCSASETSMMALNRYRLKHLVKHHHGSALRCHSLLKRSDRLLGAILIGNTFANILASSLATILATYFFGDLGVLVSTILLTIFVLIFGEILPKTYAALHAEKVAFTLSFTLVWLLRLLYPIVVMCNALVNGMLKAFGIEVKHGTHHSPLSHEELHSVVSDSQQLSAYRSMLLGVLELEKATVEDVMIPRSKIIGIDITASVEDILKIINQSPYSKLPVYREEVDNLLGILHLRKLLPLMNQEALSKKALISLLTEPYFVPITTSLRHQLQLFREVGREFAIAVNEYGEIQGLITLEDIIEEIAGEFTRINQPSSNAAIAKLPDGTFIVKGDLGLRDINRELNLSLPTHGPKTLNGLILEQLGDLPIPDTKLTISGYPMEIIKVEDNAVTQAKIFPKRENDSRE
jgi:Mg2+/Co2+ transporter CorB